MNGKKLLIVEDHRDCRELLEIVLSRLGYMVVQVGTGLEAVERASATSPDLIVMDFGLPDVTADTVIMRLKADPVTERIPVIVTTGYMTPEITRRAMAAGAAMVLIKPYAVDELMTVIEDYFSSESAREPLPLELELWGPANRR